MTILSLVVEAGLECLKIAGILLATFLVLLFSSEILLKVLELTGAQRIPEIGELFCNLVGFMVVSGGIIIFGFALSHSFGHPIDSYGVNFQFYFVLFFLLWFLSLCVVILSVAGVINLEDLINSFVKNLPSPHLEKLPKHYDRW